MSLGRRDGTADIRLPPCSFLSFLFTRRRCLCLVATERAPRDYLSYLAAVRAQTAAGSGRSAEDSQESKHWGSIQVVDGFSDPLGWNLEAGLEGRQEHAAGGATVGGVSSSAAAYPDISRATAPTTASTARPLARLDDMSSLEGAVLQCLHRHSAAASSETDGSKDGRQLTSPGGVPGKSACSSIVVFDSVRTP